MILSASRRTDIPQFYSDWFFNRMAEGFIYVRNPMNYHQVSRISVTCDVVDCVVFWTKNPEPAMGRLKELGDIPFCFLMTITGYGREIEPGTWDKRHLIKVFQELSGLIGPDRIIWRYDPVFMSDRYSAGYHEETFRQLAQALHGYTRRVIFSFMDLYGKTRRNMSGIPMFLPDQDAMVKLASFMSQTASHHGMILEACAEMFDFSRYGVKRAGCIDSAWMEEVCGFPLRGGKDKNQRTGCGCMESVEIGTYDTCLNGCKYCYANDSQSTVVRQIQYYDPASPYLCGKTEEGDRVTTRKVESLRRLI